MLLYGTTTYIHNQDVTIPFGVTLPFIPAVEAYQYDSVTGKPISGNPFISVTHSSLVFPYGSEMAGKLVPVANLARRFIVFNIPVGGNSV